MALVVRDKWEMMGECLTSMPNISTSTYQMRCTVVRPDGSSITDVFTVGLVQGTLMIYDQKGMSRTWSDAREELSDIEFLDPALNARLQDLEKQVSFQQGANSNMELQQVTSALTGALTANASVASQAMVASQNQTSGALSLAAQINASAALERQSAAAVHAVANSAAFNAGKESGLATQVQNLVTRFEIDRDLNVRERERLSQAEQTVRHQGELISQLQQRVGKDEPDVRQLRAELTRVQDALATLQDDHRRIVAAADAKSASDRLFFQQELARLKDASDRQEQRWERQLQQVLDAQKTYPEKMVRIEALLSANTAGEDADSDDGESRRQQRRESTARLVRISEEVEEIREGLRVASGKLGTLEFSQAGNVALLNKRLTSVEQSVQHLVAEQQRREAAPATEVAGKRFSSTVEHDKPSLRIVEADRRERRASAPVDSSDDECGFSIMDVRTWSKELEGLSTVEVELALRKLFFDDAFEAPTPEAKGYFTALMTWVNTAQSMPELYERQAVLGNSFVSRLTVALKRSEFPTLTFAKLDAARRGVDTGMSDMLKLVRSVAPVKKSSSGIEGKKKAGTCFNCGGLGHIASRCPGRMQRTFSGSRPTHRTSSGSGTDHRAMSGGRSKSEDRSKNRRGGSG